MYIFTLNRGHIRNPPAHRPATRFQHTAATNYLWTCFAQGGRNRDITSAHPAQVSWKISRWIYRHQPWCDTKPHTIPARKGKFCRDMKLRQQTPLTPSPAQSSLVCRLTVCKQAMPWRLSCPFAGVQLGQGKALRVGGRCVLLSVLTGRDFRFWLYETTVRALCLDRPL